MGTRPKEWIELEHLFQHVDDLLRSIWKSVRDCIILFGFRKGVDKVVSFFLVDDEAQIFVLVNLHFLKDFA